MILSVHATFGAAVASLVPTHPVEAFVLGFVSHLAIDAIPHKDYELISVDVDEAGKPKPLDLISKKLKLLRDMTLVSFDAVVGLCLAFLFFFNPAHPSIFLIGAVAAMIPDFLTFLYLLLKHKPLRHFFDFHASFIHSQTVLKLNQITGVLLQFCTVAVLIAIIFGVKYVIIL